MNTHAPPRRQVLGGALAVLVGALVAVQSLINGEVAEYFGDGVVGGSQAALISFVTGLILLCAAVLAWKTGRHGVATVFRALRLRRLRPWQVMGGAFGAFVVLSQSITVPVIGVAVFTVAIVAGQGVSGVLVDKIGIGPAGPQAVTAGRAVGAALSVVAVGLTVASRIGGPDRLSTGAVLLVLLPLLAGIGTSWQQAINGKVALLGGPLAATWVNFVVGAVVLVVAWIVVRALIGAAEPLPPLIGPSWWLYSGGLVGVAFIAMSAVLVRILGVLVLALWTIAGQVLASLVFDLITGRPVGALTVIGAALTLVGVVIAGLSTRRRRAAFAVTPAASAPPTGAATETSAES